VRCQIGGLGVSDLVPARTCDPFRQTEVQHFYVAIKSHHDVGRLEVAMDDPRFVCGAEGLDHLANDI